MSVPYPLVIAVLVFVGLCAVEDIRTRRIPNVLSGSAMVVGAMLNGLYHGLPGVLASLGGLLVILGALLPPFAMGGVGGGDVKMMGAVGAFLGIRLGIAALLAGLMLGGLVMLLHLARVGRLREKLAATGSMVWLSAATRSLAPLRVSPTDARAIALPYSVPLALGTAAVVAGASLGGF